MSKLQIIPGPLASKVSKAEAEQSLINNPGFVKGSSYELEKIEGRWVAAIAAGPPFGADAPEDAPEPTLDDGPPEPDADESDPFPELDDSDDGDKDKDDKKDDKKGDKKGLEGEVSKLTDMVSLIVDALGLGEEGSPLPGGDDLGPDGPPPGGPPPGLDGPPPPPSHDHPLKPGEAPPGATPVGAPAFANVRADHPWADMVNKVASFTVEDGIGDIPNNQVRQELQTLASEIGYSVRQFKPYEREGQRHASALISRY